MIPLCETEKQEHCMLRNRSFGWLESRRCEFIVCLLS